MRFPLCRVAAAALLAVACGVAIAQDSTEPPPVRIFDAGELPLERYTVLKRLWTGTWRASLWMTTHSDVTRAIEALTAEAADAGADGVVNLHCLRDIEWDGHYLCYGLAIKLKQPAAFIEPSPTASN